MDNSIEEYVFTDDEIKEQLALLGFSNINEKKFEIFKNDLKRLIQTQRLSDESQIFNDELNKIQKEKLSKNTDHYNYDYDNDYSDISTTIASTTESDYDLESLNRVKTNRKVFFNDEKNKTDDFEENRIRIKRKIMRKLPTGASKTYSNYITPKHLIIEKNVESNVNYLNENFNNLKINKYYDDNDNDEYNEEKVCDELVFDNDEDGDEEENDEQGFYTDRKSTSQASLHAPVKSFIRSSSSLSTKFEDPSRIRKSNPVSLYHEYAKSWSKQKAPGEKNHNNIRWAVREKMLDKHVIVKQQPIQPVNNYIVPTDKKRSNLRWTIRSALANVSK